MRSVQSAYSGEALVFEEQGKAFIFDRRTETCREVAEATVGQWLRSHGELRQVDVKDIAELRASLGQYAGCRTGLSLALFSIDADLDESIRRQAAKLLDRLLATTEVRNWLQDLFFIQPLPEESVHVARDSLSHAVGIGLANYVTFFQSILEWQAEICRLSDTWREIEDSTFFGKNHPDVLERVLGTGLFKDIVSGRQRLNSLDLALLASLKARSVFEPEILARINSIDINYAHVADAIGLKDASEGIEYFDWWGRALAVRDPTEERRVSVGIGELATEGLLPPIFGINRPFGSQNLVVRMSNHDVSMPIPEGMYKRIESMLALESGRRKLKSRMEFIEVPIRTNPHVKSAIARVAKWGGMVRKGACEVVDSVGAIRIRGRGKDARP